LIRAADAAGLQEAARILKSGGLVGMPTETVYGLAADAFQALACAKIFEAKARPAFDPLIVHLASQDWLERVALGVPEEARRLAAAFWPGPLTLVLPKRPEIPGIVSSGLDTVAVRVPAHPVALELLRLAGTPLAAPSANRFGGLSPTRAQHVVLGLGDAVPLVLDGGPCSVGVESTIVDLSRGKPRLLRPGGLPRESIEAALGYALELGPAELEKPLAPGQLASHYAPVTRLELLQGPASEDAGDPSLGLLAFSKAPGHHHYGEVEVLSPRGDLAEAAARLFDCLHRLDGLRLDGIDAEPVPPHGLGLAILDRLTRASAGARSAGGA
jgi:L-threonylcarbamoyladenylate synthase